jgi:hypothetical protein
MPAPLSGKFFKTVFTLPKLGAALPPAMAETLCTSEQPLLMLPVRLETRFFPQPGGASELRIRIYPDKIHLDSHENDLTPDEHDWATHYWQQDWLAGNDAAARGLAWDQLATRFGAPRAAWLARQLRPTNQAQRPITRVLDGQTLSPPPIFPSVTIVSDGKNAAWRSAAMARLIPDRWFAIVQSGGEPILAASGRKITNPLAVGPNPQATPPATPVDQPTLDPAMQWMVDYSVAEAAGMALRMTLTAAQLAAGLDSLVVLGVCPTNSTDTANALSALLDAHHYTDGLEFLPLGTPTNNTADARSGYSSDDTGHRSTFACEIQADPAAFDASCNAKALGAAFGFSDAQTVAGIGHVAQANQTHEADQRAMASALWQAGWGNYLANMVGYQGTGLAPDDSLWARDHFVRHVRTAGPFAALRCGRQPYGVLPVTSLDLWKPPTGQEASFARDSWLQGLLIRLRDNIWRNDLGAAARIGATQPADPDADLANVMRTDAQSNSYTSRTALGRHYLQHLRAFLGEDLQADGFIAAQDAITARALQAAGIAWHPRLAQFAFADLTFDVTAPLIQPGDVAESDPLNPDYIGALVSERSIDALVALRPGPPSAGSGTTLLQALLRHALLREVAEAVARIAAQLPNADLASLLADIELVDLVTNAAPSTTWRRQLLLVVPAVTGTQTIQQYLEALSDFSTAPVAALGDARAGLAHLRTLSNGALRMLMQGTLDLSGHRLDAWITSFATKRLAAMRASQPTGLYAGGFGWVENLKPADPAATSVATPPAGETAPLVKPANDSGFIHAPSLTHASAAALLRDAHLGNRGSGQAAGPFAIDLSSRRGRDARTLLEGVRQGQPLGALLGYRVERSLHQLALDAFISPLREIAPLVAGKLEQTTLPVEAIAANNVVDGLVLQRKWTSNKASVTARLQAAGATSANLTKIGAELDALADTIDGLSDALTAEAAYQVTRGNTLRTAGTLAAVASGDAPAPELEVLRMPRSGISAVHRMVVLRNADLSLPAGWPTAVTPRAAAEPVLNAWAAGLLGNPSRTRCTIEKLDAAGRVTETHVLQLADTGCAPLDVVFGVDTSGAGLDPGATQTEVELAVLYRAVVANATLAPPAIVRIQHARPGDLAAGELTLFDVIEQARAVRVLLTSARGLLPDDLAPPDRAASASVDLAELEGRVTVAEAGFSSTHGAAATLIGQGDNASLDGLRAALLSFARYGIASAISAIARGNDGTARLALAGQLAALLKTSQSRLDQTAALKALAPASSDVARLGQLRDRMGSIFGSSFVVAPRISCGPAAAQELSGAISTSQQTFGGDALAGNGWLTRYARVRDPLARFNTCLRGAEILATGEHALLAVAQLPRVTGERWIGLPLAANTPMLAGKLSLMVQLGPALDTTKPIVGLWIDEWTEIVPNTEETTALAFQFNPPDACAPQCALLAVPPVPGAAWSVGSLYRVLVETLDLAKLRAIDAEALADIAQYLPGLFLAFNAKEDAVSTDFSVLTG